MFEWNNSINKIEKMRILGVIPSVAHINPKSVGNLILDFLSEHASLRADFDVEFDDEEDKYASPDSANLYVAAKSLIETGTLPKHYQCYSSWESGGYAQYNDKDAREIHDAIVKLLCRNMSVTEE